MSTNDFTPCSTCETERETSTLDANGQCPFCVDAGVPPPAPAEPPAKVSKYPEIIVRPLGTDSFAAARAAKKAPQTEPATPKIPKASNPALQQALDEAFELPYAAPAFDLKEAEADPEKEMAHRALCRRRFLPFVQRYRPKYMAGWVHEDICRRLERFMQQVEAGQSPRLLLMMPPRSGKSELGSRHFPPWVLGQHPEWEIIAASHTSSLTLSFSRYIRDLTRDPSFQALFPDMRLDPTSQSVENWNTLSGGGYMAAGVGTGITGRGAHILLLDDLVKDIEAADSPTIRENTWEWYGSTAYTRLAPGGGVLGIMCMTGDTPVMMADGTEKPLALIRGDDMIATYENGKLTTTRVDKQKSVGPDSVLKITMISGKVVRANGRHPFLATTATGELKWIRARSLSTANRIVTLKGSGESGREHPVLLKGATNRLNAGGYATRTMGRNAGRTGTVARALSIGRSAVKRGSSIATGLLSQITTRFSNSKEVSAPFVRGTDDATQACGTTPSQSTTATTLAKSGAYSATTATPESDILELSPSHEPLHDTSDFTLSEILSIEPDGVEEVFDIQVDRTTNFIANGLCVSNTWWNEDDWAGKIQQVMASGDGDVFEVIKYPAINDEGDEYLLLDDSIVQYAPESTIPEGAKLTRPRGTAIHPARYDTEAMLRIKRNLVASGQKRVWQALYQQNPTPDDGIYFSKEMIHYYVHAPQRRNMFIYQAWDFAITEATHNDYTVCCTIGQDEFDNLYVLHVLRFRSDDGNAIVEHMIDQSINWGADLLGFEDGQIFKSIRAQYEKRCLERQHYTTFEILQPLTDKLVRANPLKGRMQLHKVFIKKDEAWTGAFVRELMTFPAGKHDDQVDAAAWCVRLTLTRSAPRPKPPPKTKSWRDKLGAFTEGAGETSHMAA